MEWTAQMHDGLGGTDQPLPDASLFEAVLGAISDAVLLTDATGRILYACPNVDKTFGEGSARKLAGTSIADLLGQPLFDPVRLEAEGELTNLDRTVLDQNGAPHEILVNVKKVDIGRGSVLYTCRQVTEYNEATRSLARSRLLLEGIQKAQSLYIQDSDGGEVFENLLDTLIESSESRFGFLDEVRFDPDGTPYKVSRAISDLAWDDQSGLVYEQLKTRDLEFRNLDNLAGAPVLTGTTVIANDPANDPRSGGLPEGHPQLNSFMGIPLYFGGELIGVVGVGNRKGGYSAELSTFLEPLCTTCAGIIHAVRQREHEQVLRAKQAESAARFDTLKGTYLDGFWLLDSEGGILEANKAYADMSGYSVDMLTTMHVHELDAEEDAQRTRQHIKELKNSGSGRFRAMHRRRDGARYPVEVSTTYLPDQDQIIAFLRDLSEAKKAEQDLRESEERFRVLFETAADAIFVADPDTGMVIDANLKATELTGRTREELVQLHQHELHPPEEAQFCRTSFQESLRSRGAKFMTMHLLHKRGRRIPVEISSGGTVAAGGRPFHFGIFRDLTQRMQAEASLRSSEARFRALSEAVPAGIVIHDRGVIVEANERYYEMFGYRREELVGVDARIRTMTRESYEDSCERVSQRNVEPYESTGLRKDGATFPMEVHPRIYEAQGRVLRAAVILDITKRKRTEQALRDTQEKYRIVADFAQNWETWVAPDGQLLYSSPSVYHLTGYTADEVYRDPGLVTRMVHPDDRERVERHLASELTEAERTLELTYRILTREGAEKWLAHSCAPVHGDTGQFRGRRASTRDITAQRLADGALRESEERFRALVEAAPMGIYLIRDGKYSYGNPAGLKMLGFDTMDELRGAAALERIAPEYHALLRERITRVEKGMGNPPVELEVLDCSGKRIWTLSTSVSLQMDGLPVAFVVSQDITALKHAEQSLQESNDRYRALAMQSVDCMILHDLDGRIVDVNPRACATYGYSREELLHMHVADLDPDYRDRAEDGAFYARMQPDEATVFEARQKSRDGRVFPVEVRLSRVAVGEESLIQGLCRDITLEEEAALERARLQEELAQAQKMESIGRLAGGVAHDYNNMLGVIIGHAELLLEAETLSERVRECVLEISKAAERSASLTRQLLAFARRQTSQPQPLDINDAIGSMLKMIGRLIGENIELSFKPMAGLGMVLMDPSQLDQILANLAVNARDAIGHSAGTIVIETRLSIWNPEDAELRPGSSPGRYITLSFQDSGCGMDEETAAQIFEPFFTTKGVGEGTGLGLATVYGIVKQNRGHVECSTRKGEGTTFHIYLPEQASTVVSDQGAESLARALPRGKETVLLVEDEDAFRDVVTITLRRLGYTVLTASSPDEALDLVRADGASMSLLITDVVMPGRSGHALAEEVKSVLPSVKVLFISGYPAEGLSAEALTRSGVHFLRKPFRRAELARKVREALDT